MKDFLKGACMSSFFRKFANNNFYIFFFLFFYSIT